MGERASSCATKSAAGLVTCQEGSVIEDASRNVQASKKGRALIGLSWAAAAAGGQPKLKFRVRFHALNYAGSARSPDAQGRNTVEAVACLAAKQGRNQRSCRSKADTRAWMPYLVKKVGGLALARSAA